MRKITLRQSDFYTFMQCRRKFYLQQDLESTETKITSAHIGTAVHTALRAHYLKQSIPAALEQDKQQLVQSGYAVDDINKTHTLTTKIMDAYVLWAEDRHFVPFLVEERIERQVGVYDDIELWMSGQIDLVVADKLTEKFRLIDHKTVTNLSQSRQMLQMNFQGLSYAWLLQEKDIYVSGLIHNQLRRVDPSSVRSKPPFFSREEVIWTAEQQKNHELHLFGLGKQIAEFLSKVEGVETYPHEDAYPTPGQHCSWSCKFRELCPMFDDGSDVKTAIELGFKIGQNNV